MSEVQKIFTAIYQENKWGDKHTRSGRGSNLMETEVIRTALPLLVKELNCKSLLDVPCGDFFWMKTLEMALHQYIGGDIVAELIEHNQSKYSGHNRNFIHLDLTQHKLPQADLVLCRDCLVHLPTSQVLRALKNIKDSGSTYLLTTTFIDRIRNKDILIGAWRPLNLQVPPFNFPPPLKLIDEKCPSVGYPDKHLGLWQVADIPHFQ